MHYYFIFHKVDKTLSRNHDMSPIISHILITEVLQWESHASQNQ